MTEKMLQFGRTATAIAFGAALVALTVTWAAAREFNWKPAIATVFWVGEASSDDNGHIANFASAWDRHWLENFGGVDDPEDRCGFHPCGFTPKENPFYVALPYDDMTEDGAKKATAALIPWKGPPRKSALKNRWIAVRADGRTCYAQWQDVGPFESDDADYVFGDAREPRNKQITGAGIDLSPAVKDCLQVQPVSHVAWRHVDDKDVPDGPWRKIVTTRPGP
jgi:hypothetical protein